MSSDIKGFGIVVEAQALHCPNSVIDRIKDCRGECDIPYRYCGNIVFLLRRAIALSYIHIYLRQKSTRVRSYPVGNRPLKPPTQR